MKEEAIRLVERFRRVCMNCDDKGDHNQEIEDFFAKRCALICLEEMENTVDGGSIGNHFREIKKEIEAL